MCISIKTNCVYFFVVLQAKRVELLSFQTCVMTEIETTLVNRLQVQLDEAKTKLSTVNDAQDELETTKVARFSITREIITVVVDYLD